MYKRILWAALAAAVALGLMTAAAPADDKKPAEKPAAEGAAPQPSPPLRALNGLELAFGLVHYARAHKTPEGLVTAALILHRTPTQPLQAKVEGAKEAPAESGLAPKALLEEARAMRKDDKALAGVVDRARDELKEAPRGGHGPNMPYSGAYSMAARGVIQVWKTFPAGAAAVITVATDAQGEGLASFVPPVGLTVAAPGTGQAVPLQATSGVGWTRYTFAPKVGGDYLITVRNTSNLNIACFLTTN
jgi:hypothetical protein